MLWVSIAAACVQILALVVSCVLCRNIVNFEIVPYFNEKTGVTSSLPPPWKRRKISKFHKIRRYYRGLESFYMTTISKSFSKNEVDDYLDGDYVTLYLKQNTTLGRYAALRSKPQFEISTKSKNYKIFLFYFLCSNKFLVKNLKKFSVQFMVENSKTIW